MNTKFFQHPTALVESTEVGEGTRVWAFVQVQKGAVVGKNCNIGNHCFIEQGAVIGSGVTVKNLVSVWDSVTLEDDVFVGPSVVFTNHPSPRAFIKEGRTRFLPTRIEKGATLGAGSVILCGTQVGKYALVAAGAVVLHSVRPHQLVAGNPAKPKGWVCMCSKKRLRELDAQTHCEHCGFRFGSLLES